MAGPENPSWVMPRPAATLICLRDAEPDRLEALMTVRHQTMVFGSGALVFPGGRVEAVDQEIAAAGAALCDKAAAGMPPEALGFRIAAIRETFEEAGLLLARDARSGEPVGDERLQELVSMCRAQICAGTLSFSTFLERERFLLSTGELTYFAHWVTPRTRPKRFDTHFFLARAPHGQVAGHDSGEAVATEWITPARAIEQTAAGRYKLLFPTRMNLLKLARWSSVADATAAATQSEIVAVEPEWITGTDHGDQIRIPETAGYGGSHFPVIDPPAM